MNPKEELAKAKKELAKVRGRMAKLGDEMDLLKARIESDDYPSFRTEDFRGDDWKDLDRCRREMDELEVRERELVSEVRAWKNTVADGAPGDP